MTESVPPYAYCATCKKPSWNQRDIGFSKWKWGKYMCLACSPMTQKVLAENDPLTQKPQVNEVSTSPKTHTAQGLLEPVYHRPPEEVQKELDWLADTNNRIEDIPL